MTRFITLLTCIAILMGCNKETDPPTNLPPTTFPPIGLLKSISDDNGTLIEYEYTDDYIIESSYETNNGDFVRSVDYTISNDTIILTFLNGTNQSISKSYYISDNVVRQDNYTSIGLYSYSLSYYNGEDCGVSFAEVYLGDTLNATTTFEYLDDNCSATATIEPIGIYYTGIRDDKNYLRNSLDIWNTASQTQGNVYQYDRYNSSGTLTYSYGSVFDYNSDDYPISEIKTDSDGQVTEYTYEYY